jgi:hypothetical protein
VEKETEKERTSLHKTTTFDLYFLMNKNVYEMELITSREDIMSMPTDTLCILLQEKICQFSKEH